jgi:hypothetical protein
MRRNDRWLSRGDPGRLVSTGRTRIVLLAVIGLLLAVLSPLVVSALPASAATAVWGTPTQVPLPAADEGGHLTSVSCSDPLDCTAVGEADVGLFSAIEPIAITETNGVWGSLVLFPVGNKDLAEWNSVRCTSAGNCVAVGSSGELGGAGVHSPVYATETGGQWSAATVFLRASNASPDALPAPWIALVVTLSGTAWRSATSATQSSPTRPPRSGVPMPSKRTGCGVLIP